jgi:DNA processing protein
MTENPLPYWMAFAHAGNFTSKRKMDFLVEAVHDKESIISAINKLKSGERLGFPFTDKEWEGVQEAIAEIPNYAFLAEKLTDQRIEIVHVMEKYAYPKVLKENLKKDAPIVIYTKGNADLLNKNSVAIVGSRNCSPQSLEFTDTVAKNAVAEKSVVVSGFAKGVDKQALESALIYKGQSIVVLPQGIHTYHSKSYYAAMVRGDVLFISTYHPMAPWSVGLAMDRNKIIYGLANEIYAAESGDSGGTWEGVLNGIKRGRKVFVRLAREEEKNANNQLIAKGATPVDVMGKVIDTGDIIQKAEDDLNEKSTGKQDLFPEEEIISRTIGMIKSRQGKGVTLSEVINLLQLNKKSREKIDKLLSSHPELVKTRKGRENCYYLKDQIPQQTSMF